MKMSSLLKVQIKRRRDTRVSLLNALQVISLIGFSLFTLSVRAAPVTLVGETISYVYDDSQSALLLFGAPAIQGDVVRFLPGSFRAESLNGVGADMVSATFQFSSVYSNTGKELSKIEVYEFGDYEIINAGPDTAGAIQAHLAVSVSNNNDFTEFSTASNGIYGGVRPDLQTYEFTAAINPAQEFESNASDVALSISNNLFAVTSANGEVAWIQKKMVFAAVTQVPVPAAAWLFGSALLGLGTLRHRKKQLQHQLAG